MKYTENYNLKKPEPTDYINLEDFNENADAIDGKLKENENKVSSHLADIASQEIGKGADIIGLPDPDNLFTATNIGGAMSELFTNVSDGKDLVGGVITDVDENVVIPTEPTFQDLADGISNISTGKKWANGSVPTGSGTISVELDFIPSFLLAVWKERGVNPAAALLSKGLVADTWVKFGSGSDLFAGHPFKPTTNVIRLATNILSRGHTIIWVAIE